MGTTDHAGAASTNLQMIGIDIEDAIEAEGRGYLHLKLTRDMTQWEANVIEGEDPRLHCDESSDDIAFEGTIGDLEQAALTLNDLLRWAETQGAARAAEVNQSWTDYHRDLLEMEFPRALDREFGAADAVHPRLQITGVEHDGIERGTVITLKLSRPVTATEAKTLRQELGFGIDEGQAAIFYSGGLEALKRAAPSLNTKIAKAQVRAAGMAVTVDAEEKKLRARLSAIAFPPAPELDVDN